MITPTGELLFELRSRRTVTRLVRGTGKSWLHKRRSPSSGQTPFDFQRHHGHERTLRVSKPFRVQRLPQAQGPISIGTVLCPPTFHDCFEAAPNSRVSSVVRMLRKEASTHSLTLARVSSDFTQRRRPFDCLPVDSHECGQSGTRGPHRLLTLWPAKCSGV